MRVGDESLSSKDLKKATFNFKRKQPGRAKQSIVSLNKTKVERAREGYKSLIILFIDTLGRTVNNATS